MIYNSKEARLDYAPPMLGNGSLAVCLDYQGTHQYDPCANPAAKMTASGRSIWWAGRRYSTPFPRPLIPFGQITQQISCGGRPYGEPEEWEQGLDPVQAVMRSSCRYSADLCMDTEAFLHHDGNLLALQKRFRGQNGVRYRLEYRLAEEFGGGDLPREFTLFSQRAENGAICLDYQVKGQWDYAGRILFFSDALCTARIEGNCFSLETLCEDGESCHFYLAFGDSLDPDSPADQWLQAERTEGYEGLLRRHMAAWVQYHRESGVQLPDRQLQAVYQTAQYDLKVNTTKWSIPTCINDVCWHGRYFAFDEYFGFYGLLTSNHFSLAQRVTDFRFDGLEKAITRASSKEVTEARYPWETVETQEEAAPPGFWYEHIFHMANAALAEWDFVEYTGRLDYLREKAYPVMRACAEFFVRHMLYDLAGGKTIVGRCTDLERLGSSVQNAFMTTCSVISTLRAAADAADLLGEDAELADEYRDAADRLFSGLPHDGGRYIPCPGCSQRSIAVFAGCYPYPVFKEYTPLLANAFADYLENEKQYGNMYAVGSGTSTWYAAWKAIAFARLGAAGSAYGALKQAAATAGCFGEIFEINEDAVRNRPWFTTAAGMYLAAVNESLLQSKGDAILVAPGIPESSGTFSFTLPAKKGRIISAGAADGKLTGFSVSGELPVQVRFPDWLDCGILRGTAGLAETAPGCFRVQSETAAGECPRFHFITKNG